MPQDQALILKEYIEERWSDFIEFLSSRGHEDAENLAEVIADHLNDEE